MHLPEYSFAQTTAILPSFRQRSNNRVDPLRVSTYVPIRVGSVLCYKNKRLRYEFDPKEHGVADECSPGVTGSHLQHVLLRDLS